MLNVGDSRRSQGRTITEADLLAWGGLVHDFTPLHFDHQLMSQSPFSTVIAHGYIALNLSVGMFFPDLQAWYAPDRRDTTVGWTDIEFLAPVRVGDTLYARREVVEVAATVSLAVEVVNQDDTVVMKGIEHIAIDE